MASRQHTTTTLRNRTTMQQGDGADASQDLNGTVHGDSSDISCIQPIVRRGSVISSRVETMSAYRKQRGGDQRAGTEQQSDTTANLSGYANDMCALNNWPSHARRNRTQIQNETDGQRKDGRGVLKGITVSKKRFANGSGKLNVEFSDKLGGSVGINYRSFVDDVVVYMKRRTPLIGVRRWSDIHPTVHRLIVADVIGRWNLEDTPAAEDRILKIAKERYRGWRSTLHSTYKAYNSDAARMANVPKDLKWEEWQWLIEYFGTDSKFQEISQKNSDNRKKLKAKHKVGSKSYAQISYEKRDAETGEEPDSISLWEMTHRRNGVWSNNESQAVYENAHAEVLQKEGEMEVLVSTEEKNNIFQTAYRTTLGCTSSQPRGFGYMAKAPTGADRIRAELDDQARATVETQRQNVELSHQVIELQGQLDAERLHTQEQLAFDRAEREKLEQELRQERAETTRLLEEERKARQLELDAFMAKVTQMMGAQQTTTQQIPPTRTGNKVIANSNMMGAQQTTTQQIPPTRTGNKVIANSNMMGAKQTTTQQIPPTRTGNKVIANSNMTRSLFETSNTGVALGKKTPRDCS